MNTNKQTRVMHMAHILYSYSRQLSCVSDVHPDWSTSVREAWAIQHVREALLSGAVMLTYYSKSGNETTRVGTLSGDLIPSNSAPQGIYRQEIQDGLREPVWDTVNYYDLTKKGWRSFNIANLVSVEACKVEYGFSLGGESLYYANDY